jgi:hypothetical protein
MVTQNSALIPNTFSSSMAKEAEISRLPLQISEIFLSAQPIS